MYCETRLLYFASTVETCPAHRLPDKSGARLSPLGIESTFTVLGHNPKSVSPGSLTKKNNICTVFRGRQIDREREREATGEAGKEGQRGNLIMYAFSCEREQKERKCVRVGGGGKERERENDCVYVRETFL